MTKNKAMNVEIKVNHNCLIVNREYLEFKE